MIADVENVVDVFQLHRRVIDNYSTYVDSFLSIADDEIRDFVRHKLIEERALWPDALIQLNPAYERAQTIAEQCDSGVLHSECGRIFRMLELMLVRPRERKFVHQHSTELQFLVFDELHTYRGRQGAGVALLIRRLQERVITAMLKSV